jgi:hypothetical protein
MTRPKTAKAKTHSQSKHFTSKPNTSIDWWCDIYTQLNTATWSVASNHEAKTQPTKQTKRTSEHSHTHSFNTTRKEQGTTYNIDDC